MEEPVLATDSERYSSIQSDRERNEGSVGATSFDDDDKREEKMDRGSYSALVGRRKMN